MSIEHADHEIKQIERRLLVDDPQFVRHMRNLRRREAAHTIIVFVCLAAGAVLFTIGLATLSTVAWLLGAASLMTAVVADSLFTKH